MKRAAIVRKSELTNLELGQLVRERDEWPVERVFRCGCTWNTVKGGLSEWHRCRACGPWAAPYRSKKKYTERTG